MALTIAGAPGGARSYPHRQLSQKVVPAMALPVNRLPPHYFGAAAMALPVTTIAMTHPITTPAIVPGRARA